jgi:intein/homing endonuclease
VYLSYGDEEIVTTPFHPFYVPQKGWTSAVDLRAGDILVTVNGEYVVLEKVQHEILETTVTVYNFEVEDFHTYYVGEEPVLVHNICKGTSDDFLKLSNNKEATQVANKMGYAPTKELSSGQKVFVNKSAPSSLRYITRDIDSHNGGVWKAAKTIKDLGSRATRSGTYSRWLNIRIGG